MKKHAIYGAIFSLMLNISVFTIIGSNIDFQHGKNPENQERQITINIQTSIASGDGKAIDQFAKKSFEKTAENAKKNSISEIQKQNNQTNSTSLGEKKSDEIINENFDLSQFQNPYPKYPLLSKQKNEHGTVGLCVNLIDGMVQEIRICSSSGYKLLDESAAKTVEKWQFPKVTREIKISISFELK